jgi:tRNA modification GTPase
VEDTIIALATPQARSALALLRLSGKDSFNIVGHCIKEKEKFAAMEDRRIALYTFINEKKDFIDEITAIKYLYQKSYTGEDLVEIICHGSPIIIEEIVHELIIKGARAAAKGEFTRRAYENGKIDLLKAESINGLIESTTFSELQASRNNYLQKHDGIITTIKDEILQSISEIEADIEFNDEDDVREKDHNYQKKIKNLYTIINNEIKKSEKLENNRDGIKIIIAGPSNAGKSSLFNYLVNENQAIIHPEPGTTRDILRQNIKINTNQVEIIDSAGIRDTVNEVEVIGIEKTVKELEKAQIVLWITAVDEEFSEKELDIINKLSTHKKVRILINKIDKEKKLKKKEILKARSIVSEEISITRGINLESIYQFICEAIDFINNEMEMPDIIQTVRQKEIIIQIRDEIEKCLKEKAIEIKAYYLHTILSKIDEIVGKTTKEEIINSIFDRFCIGK